MDATVKGFRAKGEIFAPPSKSHAHRLIIAAALGEATTTIENVGRSEDAEATLRCVNALGAKAERQGDDVIITGVFSGGASGRAVFDCGESGSTWRFMLPVAAALGISAEFKGKGRLMQRPNAILTNALSSHGYITDGKTGKGRLSAGRYEIDAAVSSQYITGLLFALPLLDGDSEIIFNGETVSANYIEMTFSVLDTAGIKYSRDGKKSVAVYGGQKYSMPEKVRAEGDWSGAAFILALGALCGEVCVSGLKENSVQSDRAICDILKAYGADVSVKESGATAKKARALPFEVSVVNCPDLAPVLCVLAATAKGRSVVSGVQRLKDKESDRLAAIEEMLSVAGVKTKEAGDSLEIFGGEINSGKFDGCRDHRIVMAAAVLAAAAKGTSTVSDAEAVNKSYPSFFGDMQKLKGEENVGI